MLILYFYKSEIHFKIHLYYRGVNTNIAEISVDELKLMKLVNECMRFTIFLPLNMSLNNENLKENYYSY